MAGAAADLCDRHPPAAWVGARDRLRQDGDFLAAGRRKCGANADDARRPHGRGLRSPQPPEEPPRPQVQSPWQEPRPRDGVPKVMLAGPPAKARWSLRAVALSTLLLGGCNAQAGRDPFTASGELTALSGGDGGAPNACFTCHGLRGQGDGESVPRLAGLQAGLLQKQLEDYAAGRRADAVMGPVARRLGADGRRALAAYYAGMPPAAGDREAYGEPTGAARDLYHRGDVARGLPPCAACHGEAGEGAGAANPPLAGQPEAYVADQLARWKAGRRRNDPRGVMMRISQRLTASEIAALAAYVSTLSGSPAPVGLLPAASL